MVALGVDSVKMLAAAYPVISDLEKYPDRANLFAFRSSPLAKRAASALLVEVYVLVSGSAGSIKTFHGFFSPACARLSVALILRAYVIREI